MEHVEVRPVGRGYRGEANADNCVVHWTPKGEAAVEALHAEHDE